MQQTHLYDASLIVIEEEAANTSGGALVVGFAIRSYPQLIMSQFYKRRECRNLFLQYSLPVDFSNIDKVLSNEIRALKLHLRCQKADFDHKTQGGVLRYLDHPEEELGISSIKE
jgi:hypothetical protein